MKINKLNEVAVEDSQFGAPFQQFGKSPAARKKGKKPTKGKTPTEKNAEGSKAKEPSLDGSSPKGGVY
jgi:hypothetical protein